MSLVNLRPWPLTILLVLMTYLVVPPLSAAQAQTRCKCSPEARIGQCKATIKYSNKRVSIRTDVRQCAMVTWYADGEPKETTVTDSRSTEEWLGRGKPRLQVDACLVCTDRQYTSRSGSRKEVAPSKSAASFAGTWRGRAANPVTTVEAGFVLQQSGHNITGHYFQAGETDETVNSASISGNTLKMRTGPISWTLTLTGPNTMTGTWRNMFLSGPITVQRSR